MDSSSARGGRAASVATPRALRESRSARVGGGGFTNWKIPSLAQLGDNG